MKTLTYHPDLIKTMAQGIKTGAFTSNFLASIVTVVILYNYLSTTFLSIWIGLHMFVYLLRIKNAQDILNNLTIDTKSLSKKLYLSLLYTVLTPIFYAVIIWTGILSHIPDSNVLVIIILMLSLAAGSFTTLGSVSHAFILYVSFMILPLIGALLYHGGEMFNLLSFVLFIFIIIHISSGYRQYITLRDSISLKDSFETIFNQTSDGIVLVKNNRFLDCNKAIIDMFNLKSKEEFLTTDLNNFFPKYQADGTTSIKKMIKMLNIAWRDGSHSYEWVHRTTDKREFWTEIVLTRIHLNGEDLIYGVWRDISQRKEAEQKLEKLNATLERRVSTQILEVTKKTALFETIFNTAKDGIAILDLESNFLLVNKAYQEITGFSEDELYETSCIELTTAKMIEESKSVIQILIKKGHYENYEKQCVVKNGNVIDVKMNLVLMPDKKSVLMISKDMTKENLLIQEKQEQEEKILQHSKLAQMGEMISMIAHQWRQPLGAISSTAVNLKLKLELEAFDLNTEDGVKDATQYFNERLDDIESFVANLTTTIDDFRNFYKPDKISELMMISRPLKKTLKIIENSLITDNIEIVKEYNSDKKVSLFDNEIMQVFLNIFKNSQDNFRSLGNTDAKIYIKTYDTHKGITIEIFDNGGGIDEEILNKIFDPYFSTKHEKNGTGLGLYMSKIIIEEHHNGSLYAKNENDGVCFKIELPDRIM